MNQKLSKQNNKKAKPPKQPKQTLQTLEEEEDEEMMKIRNFLEEKAKWLVSQISVLHFT